MTGIEKTVASKSASGALVLCAILFCLCACTEDASYTAGVWYRRSDFDGVARTDAAGFTIGNKGTSAEAITEKRPGSPTLGNMISTMTGGLSVPICPVRSAMLPPASR